MPVRPVTSQEVINHFARGAWACQVLHNWRTGPRKDTVVPRVLQHQTNILLNLTTEDVFRTAKRCAHALGDVDKDEVKGIKEIRDWGTDFAMVQVLSFMVEELGHLPTYQEFWWACKSETFRKMLWEPAQQAVYQVVSEEISLRVARDAMRWRVGNTYYSFIREAGVLARMRERGLDARTHPLADALFKVDVWVEDVAVEVYIGNKTFKMREREGRKISCRELLADATPPFLFYTIDLLPANRYGKVYFPDPAELEKAIDNIERLVKNQRRMR